MSKELEKKQRECCSGGRRGGGDRDLIFTRMECDACGRAVYWEGNYVDKVYECTCGENTLKGVSISIQ